MLGTYAAALLVICASVPVGAAVLWVSGRREWSWIAPALGLAVITVAAWLLVRLPGEGLAALIGIAVLALACCAALPRTGFGLARLAEGAVPAAIALVAVSIPFVAEGHYGILGTGFNVDMSQHLFTASWIADPISRPPTLIAQGYPVGPHSLAVAGSELSGNLVYGFSGVTIAIPVIGAMTALAATRTLGPRRGALAAPLAALPYLVASYLAQGAFKEIFAATFLLAFAIWLWDVSRRSDPLARRGWAVPGAVLVAGMLYAYSGPGLAWIAGTIGIWALLALLRSPSRALARVRPAVAGLAVALAVLVVVVAPEASRIVDFGGSAGNVANSRDAEPGAQAPKRPLLVRAGNSDAGAGEVAAGQASGDAAAQEKRTLDLFDNDLGNLFGDIPALEMFGVWPSGDFRVEPGDGAVPAPVFWLAALLGAAALGVGLVRAGRDRDDALIAALVAALVIWVAALALSTPYTTAKALQMVAPVLMLVALRGVLHPAFAPLRPRPGPGTVLAAAFVLAAAGSSALALANAPVGPERYTAGIAKLRPELTDVPVLMLAPAEQLADRHGAEFYGWELRGGKPICVEAFPEGEDVTGYEQPTPAGIRYVITIGGKTEPPFTDLAEVERRNRVALWEVPDFDAAKAPPVEIDPAQPANCELGLPDPA